MHHGLVPLTKQKTRTEADRSKQNAKSFQCGGFYARWSKQSQVGTRASSDRGGKSILIDGTTTVPKLLSFPWSHQIRDQVLGKHGHGTSGTRPFSTSRVFTSALCRDVFCLPVDSSKTCGASPTSHPNRPSIYVSK